VVLTPAANKFGSTPVTVTVSDGSLSTSTTFVLTVRPINDAPTISDIPDQTTGVGVPVGPTPFTVTDVKTVDDATNPLTGTPIVDVSAPESTNLGGGACMSVVRTTVFYPNQYLFLGGIMGYFGGGSFGSKMISATARMRYEVQATGC